MSPCRPATIVRFALSRTGARSSSVDDEFPLGMWFRTCLRRVCAWMCACVCVAQMAARDEALERRATALASAYCAELRAAARAQQAEQRDAHAVELDELRAAHRDAMTE